MGISHVHFVISGLDVSLVIAASWCAANYGPPCASRTRWPNSLAWPLRDGRPWRINGGWYHWISVCPTPI